MSLKENQEDVDTLVNDEWKAGYWEPLSMLARATEELGELATELNDRYGGRVKKSTDDTQDIGIEICDIFFALICLANSQKIDLDSAWKQMMNKYRIRDKDRYERKEE
jgi:NTP pyrophosphatase (non-canonical NTP hydrolase)